MSKFPHRKGTATDGAAAKGAPLEDAPLEDAPLEDAAGAGRIDQWIPPTSKPGKRKEWAFVLLLLLCLFAGLAVLAVLLVDVFVEGSSAINLNFLTSFASYNPDNAGIEAAIMGTLWLLVACAAFVIPTGVAAAIYLEEYADRRRWYNRFIELNIQNLAAVPSIVYGILGLALLVRGPFALGRVVLAGALTLGLLVLPVVVIATREALRAVPPSINEGAMALGATKWQAIWKQVLPAAVPGIATGSILALSRAIGETAPLIMVGAFAFVRFDPTGLMSGFTALPLQIYNWLSNPQDEFKVLAAGAIIVLMVILLAVNSVAIYIRNRFERKW